MVGVGGRCGVVGIGDPSVLDAARPCRLLISFLGLSTCSFARASRFMPGVATVVSRPFVRAWGSVDVLGRVFPCPGVWMTVLRLDAHLPVEGGGWLGSSQNPVPCSLYFSGTRGPSRNPGLCSLNCADWRLLSPGLSVRDVGIGRAGGIVQSGASPRRSLERSSELPVGDVGGGLLWARDSPLYVPSRGWKKLVW